MKKIMMACLLACTGNVFAQDININDLRSLLYTNDTELSNTQLSDKGFSKGPGIILLEHKGTASKASWQYIFKTEEKKHIVSTLSLFQPESGNQPMVRLETSDIIIYRKLLNQLTGEGFSYIETSTLFGLPQMHFSNGREEILAMMTIDGNKKTFQLRFQPYEGDIIKAAYAPKAKRKTAHTAVKATKTVRKKVPVKVRKSA